MPTATPAVVRRQIAQGQAQPVYLLVGDDDAEITRLVADLTGLVEDELRAFNTERIYANDRTLKVAAIVESARTLPMLGDRRVVVVLRGERLLKPKRRGKAVEEETPEDEESPAKGETDVLDAYIREPEPRTTLVIASADVDRGRKLYKTLLKHATVVECWGLKQFAQDPKDVKGWELDRIGREAAAIVTRAVKEAGRTIDQAAARLLAARAGTDIATLRGDVERLQLYVGERTHIEVRDVQDTVSGETLQDKWALNDAILKRDAKKALRQLGLAFDAGSVPYMILGQLAYCVREKVAADDPRRVPAAMEALFRTDQELKSSGGDPRVLLERLVVELCGR
jgi:DNA polymerase-3 subunit delta